MVSFTEIVSEFTGNGFTQPEAMDIAVEIALLANPDKRWVAGVAANLINDSAFDDFQPSNEWQSQAVAPLSKLKGRGRQCYFLHRVAQISMAKIADELGISEGTVQRYFEQAEACLLPPLSVKEAKKALSCLTDRQRECYELYMDSLSLNCIAKKLGIGVTTVQQHLLMAERKMKLARSVSYAG